MNQAPSALDGFLLVNKPSGPTSYDIIRVVKRLVRGVKIGHCGTLDPIASGLLILLFGKATKKQSVYMGQDKIYRAQIKFGIKTDSADITGKVVQEKPLPLLEKTEIQKALSRLTGEREQTPPMFSAIKMGGVPLYKMARKGQSVEIKPRRIRITSIDLLDLQLPDIIEIRVGCSSGTYIRSLAEEIGEQMGSVATMKALVREGIGSFNVAEAVGGEELLRANEEFLRDKVRLVS